MAEKVKDRQVWGIQRCPHCCGEMKRVEISGDEREAIVSDVCWNCGFDSGERIERRKK